MAKRGLKKGRWIVFGGLLVFVIVAAAVILRRSYGHRDGLAITELNKRKAMLESERVRLTQQIRDKSSRAVIVPIAEKELGMRIAPDSQVVMLSRTRGNGDAR